MILVKPKQDVWLGERFRGHPQLRCGRYVYAPALLEILLFDPEAIVSIGSFTQFGGTNTTTTTVYGGGNHHAEWATTFLLRSIWELDGVRDTPPGRPTRIGNDVWLGGGVTVLGGADIGDGAIVGAEAVVRGRIPPYAIATGNPATVIRRRFRDDTIARLLELRWWDWPLGRILHNADLLCSNPDEWPADLEFPAPDGPISTPPISLPFRSGTAAVWRRRLQRLAQLAEAARRRRAT